MKKEEKEEECLRDELEDLAHRIEDSVDNNDCGGFDVFHYCCGILEVQYSGLYYDELKLLLGAAKKANFSYVVITTNGRQRAGARLKAAGFTALSSFKNRNTSSIVTVWGAAT